MDNKNIEGFKFYLDEYQKIRNTTSRILHELRKRYEENRDPLVQMYVDGFSYFKEYKSKNYVYFIRNKYNNYIKIGYSSNMVQRYKNLQSICKNYLGSDDLLEIEGIIDTSFIKPKLVEAFFHDRYKQYRKFGEWFDIPDQQWNELRNLFLYDEFSEMIDSDIEDLLKVKNKLHNILYIGSPNDAEFNMFLTNSVKFTKTSDEVLEAYIDYFSNQISGCHFALDSYVPEDNKFYLYLKAELEHLFIQQQFKLPYTYQFVKNWYENKGI